MFGPNLIKDAEEKVALIRDRLKVAQSRQKSYADAKRKEVVYEIGDRAYLRVSPLRGIKRFGIKGKLAPWFIGPYRVLARKGEVAYQLEFPEGLSAIHNVFHVSQLKKLFELPEPEASSFSRFSGATTQKRKLPGNAKITSGRSFPISSNPR